MPIAKKTGMGKVTVTEEPETWEQFHKQCFHTGMRRDACGPSADVGTDLFSSSGKADVTRAEQRRQTCSEYRGQLSQLPGSNHGYQLHM